MVLSSVLIYPYYFPDKDMFRPSFAIRGQLFLNDVMSHIDSAYLYRMKTLYISDLEQNIFLFQGGIWNGFAVCDYRLSSSDWVTQ